MEGEVEELGMDQRRQRTGRGGRGIGVRRVRKKTRRCEDIPTVEKYSFLFSVYLNFKAFGSIIFIFLDFIIIVIVIILCLQCLTFS